MDNNIQAILQSVTVETSSATPDLLLIQRNKFCWISHMVPHLLLRLYMLKR